MTQTFLAAGEKRGFIAGLDDDQPVGIKTCLCERRRKEVRPRNAPEDLAGRSGSNAGRKQDGGCAMHRTGGAASDLVQRSEG